MWGTIHWQRGLKVGIRRSPIFLLAGSAGTRAGSRVEGMKIV